MEIGGRNRVWRKFLIDAIETGSVPWEPKNYDGGFDGPIRMRTALTKSKNLVSIRILQAITPQYAQGAGVMIGMEPHVGAALHRPEQVLWLLEQIDSPGLTIHFDISHFNVQGMAMEPVIEQLLPLSGERLGAPETVWDYIYEPDAQSVIDELLVRYVESLVYQAVAENGMKHCQGANKLMSCSNMGLANLRPADGMLLPETHPGNGAQALRGINPSLSIVNGRVVVDPALVDVGDHRAEHHLDAELLQR